MVHGVAYYVFVTVAALVVTVWVHLLCKYNYARGRAEGIRDEAMAWSIALDRMRVPNWQSLPIDYTQNRAQQEAANKLYVEAFYAAKEAIGTEVAVERLAALKVEFERLGFIPPPPPTDDVQGS